MIFPITAIDPEEAERLQSDMGEELRDLIAFPTYWWTDGGKLKFWPHPAPTVEIVYEEYGKPAGFWVRIPPPTPRKLIDLAERVMGDA